MITYQEFKNACRQEDPTLTNFKMKAAYDVLFGQNTIADTPPDCTGLYPATVTNQKEVDKTMIFDECVCDAPRVKARANVANAQIINNVPVEATQRDYAIQRVKAIGEKHARDLRKQFHMDPQRPETAADLIAAIKNGDYTLDTALLKTRAEEIKRGYYNNEFGIVWGTAPDSDGYEAAKEVLKDTAQKTLDSVTLMPIEALIGAIDDFEAWVYAPAA